MAISSIRQERLAKRKALVDMGIDPHGQRFDLDGFLGDLLKKLVEAEQAGQDTHTNPVPVKGAGRIVAIRNMGKSIWLDLRDHSLEKLQVNIMQKRSPEIFAQFQHVDIGDFLGVAGGLTRSKMGEPTIFADSFTILGKSLEPLPEKWHGLKRVEIRYRRRYLDLASNRDAMDTFVRRSRIIASVRRYLDSRGFLEVETPMLQSIYGGAAARPFTTHHNALDMGLFLRISPECYLKRLLVGGMDRVYEINRNFRNEGIDTTHNPEFTMLELYQSYADFNTMMEITEQIVSGLAMELYGKTELQWGDQVINVAAPWKRARFKDLIKEYAKVDPDDVEACRAKALTVESNKDKVTKLDHDHLLDLLFGELVEHHLIQPTFVTHHPAGLTPLCKRNREDPRLHDRFEAIVCGMELSNAYSEQNDPVAQRQALEEQVVGRKDDDEESYGNELDEDFVSALEVGMPPAGGLGIGIDRLVMLLTNKQSIREVVLFPTLKPRTQAEAAEEAAELEAAQEPEGESTN